jgi:hypothetical protein
MNVLSFSDFDRTASKCFIAPDLFIILQTKYMKIIQLLNFNLSIIYTFPIRFEENLAWIKTLFYFYMFPSITKFLFKEQLLAMWRLIYDL